MYRRIWLIGVLVVSTVASVLLALHILSSEDSTAIDFDHKLYPLDKANIESSKGFSGSEPKGHQSVSLYVRMHFQHRTRFYCFVLRTMVMFWQPSFGKIMIVLDQDSKEDHLLGNTLLRQMNQHFPAYHVGIAYEPPPNNSHVLDFPGSPKKPGYNRQLWSSFFIDLYTNDSIIAWMDTDAAFVTPVTRTAMFNGDKLRAIASQCTMLKYGWVKTWAKTTEAALGLPFVADFMVYFPVYIYRDTFTRCREYILRRFRTRNFEDAFMKFYKGYISPVSIILSYAWYFEKERYEWNFKICSDLAEYNKRFPVGRKLTVSEKVDVLPVPQTAHHGSPLLLNTNTLVSYCLTQKEAGNKQDKWCHNKTITVEPNLILFKHDLQRFVDLQDSPCVLNEHTLYLCLRALQDHYEEVGREVRLKQRRMDWKDLKTVEVLAEEIGFTCPPIAPTGF